MSSESLSVDADDSDPVSVSTVSSVSSATCSYFKTFSNTSSDESSTTTNIQEPFDKEEEPKGTKVQEDSDEVMTLDDQGFIYPPELRSHIQDSHPQLMKRLTNFLHRHKEEDKYVYVSRRLATELHLCDTRIPDDLLFDCCIITCTKAPLILTFVRGNGKKKISVEYNSTITRRIISVVRQDTITNFSLVGGVVDLEMCHSDKSFEKAVSDMERKASTFSIPKSLDMCERKFKLLKARFQSMVHQNDPVIEPENTTPDEDGVFDTDSCNILLIGKSGAGKSSTANTLFGCQMFKTGFYRRETTNTLLGRQRFAMTSDPLKTSSMTEGFVTYHVFDPQSIFEDEIEIRQCESLLKMPCPKVVLFVVAITQITTGINELFKNFVPSLPEEVRCATVVVLTGKDNLDADGITLDDFLADTRHSVVRELIDECGGTYVAISNRGNAGERDGYRHQLFKTIGKVFEQQKNQSHKKKPSQTREVSYNPHSNHESEWKKVPIGGDSVSKLNGCDVIMSNGEKQPSVGVRFLNSFRQKVRNIRKMVPNDSH